MQTQKNALPENVLCALESGNTLEAIRLLRAATGLGLREAKERIAAHQSGADRHSQAPAASEDLPPAVVAALQRGEKIQAIQLLRKATGMGLREAKERVDASALLGTTASSSDDRPRSGSPAVLIVCIAIVVGLVYYFLRGSIR